jgi:1-acyl-sn-glycerol-3-phosphate acyltransferase|eukprot:jgi/Chrpa1/10644/Chrysochromulina_OHIO_Genome00017264-RA
MAHFYCLDCAALTPDDYKAEVPVERWLSLCKTAGASGFGKGELTSISSPPAHVLIERFFGFPFYMLLNVLPFLLPLAWVCGVLKPILLFYVGPLFVGFVACSLFLPRAKLGKTMKELQYAYTERNTQLYLSLKMLWPASLHFPKLAEQPLLFAVIPHGFAPLGITAYPLWSKLFSRRLTRWTTAPVVLKIPIVGAGLRAIGYLPAKAHAIEETLTTKDQSVGVVLDGIAGMFQNGPVEKAWVQKRKGIVKIALRTGAPLVPVYAFGHTRLWTVVADPFGLLERLSIALDVALVLGLGVWGWPLGPPQRVPVLLACGEPIVCPKTLEPSQELIDEYHAKLVAGYQQVFEQHKHAYGWGHKELKIV